MKERKIQIGVIGGRNPSDSNLKIAEQAGALIASHHAVLICGGLGGVMEAACKGAKSKHGITVGILPVGDASAANPYVDIVIPTDLGVARNAVVVNACDGLIAIGGQYGTLSEIAFALQRGVPLASVQSWQPDENVPQFTSAEEAVAFLLAQI